MKDALFNAISEIDELKEQNSALLEALEACVKCLTMDSDMEEDFAPEIAQATEAIRKGGETV